MQVYSIHIIVIVILSNKKGNANLVSDHRKKHRHRLEFYTKKRSCSVRRGNVRKKLGRHVERA